MKMVEVKKQSRIPKNDPEFGQNEQIFPYFSLLG